MTVSKPHVWISVWFAIVIPVVIWDAFYCLLRPRSMVGGDLHWIWEPYTLYQDIDFVYGLRAYEGKEGFTSAQAAINLIETALNAYYLYVAHLSKSSAAPLVGFGAAVMTLSKTMLYLSQEYFCDWCSTGHNDAQTLFWYWIVPNGLWIIFPMLIVYQLGKDIVGSLRRADRAAGKIVNGKTQ